MSKIALENLVPGMILAAEVRDRNGRLLLGEGAGLEAKHLFIFRTWGVVEADIAGVEGADTTVFPDSVTGEKIDQAKNRLLPLYCHTDLEHPVISELLRLAVIREVQHGQ
ncbi:MAG TPA: hypothetical protein HPP97_00750 [Desulfuromonadales bacterium]|nr:hypothetical protein [Desulfuromonadales bacterium]